MVERDTVNIFIDVQFILRACRLKSIIQNINIRCVSLIG